MSTRSKARFPLDSVYVRILETLQPRARISNLHLAEAASLSPSPCLERVRRLEKGGVIRRYIADVDVDRIGANVMIWTAITLESYPKQYRAFDAAIEQVREVVESYKVCGDSDYLMRFVCADMKCYNSIMNELMQSGLGIGRIVTNVIFDRNKEFLGYPLSRLIETG